MNISAAHLHWLPAQDEERLSTLRQESCKLVDQDVLNLVCLLDLDADADTVDAGLNEDSLVLISRNGERV